jgi:23S rRNA (pseudouridine1915-N3)-methyltransferase
VRLRLLAVGRLKNAAMREACGDYASRIRRYLKLDITEVRESGRPDRAAADGRRLEGEALQRVIPAGCRVVTLTRTGTPYPSEEFAQKLSRWRDEGCNVAFIVGGAHGVDQTVLARSEETISLSPMTLPHELARLVLLEQLYRACTILRGEPYHKVGSQ